MIEASHFTGSILGAALLVLSHGLSRRLDAAFALVVVTLTLGVVTPLLKGGRYEEAAALRLPLGLWRARPPSIDAPHSSSLRSAGESARDRSRRGRWSSPRPLGCKRPGADST